MPDISMDKTLPYDLEAERSLIGAVLLDESLPDGCDPGDFYLEAHRRIWDSAVAIFNRGEKVDLITIKNTLQMRNELEAVGGVSYLASLTDGLPRMDLAPQYLRIIKNAAAARRLISACNEAISRAYMYEEPTQAIVSSVIESCDAISMMVSEGHGLRHISEFVAPTFQIIEARSSRDDTDAIATGFTDLDRLLSGGFRAPNNFVIAARPGHGKTALLSNILLNTALRGDASAFFSLEMGAYEIIERMISQFGEVDGSKMKTGFLNKDDWSRISSAAGTISTLPIYIDDSTNITVSEMRARARRLKMRVPLKLIGIDYLQLIDPPENMRKNTNEFQATAAISKGIKFMAKELDVVTVPVSQLSRESEKRKDPRPKLSDLRSSGQIEQDADAVLFVYRPETNVAYSEMASESLLILAKQRNGPIGDVRMAFRREFTKFMNLYEGEY